VWLGNQISASSFLGFCRLGGRGLKIELKKSNCRILSLAGNGVNYQKEVEMKTNSVRFGLLVATGVVMLVGLMLLTAPAINAQLAATNVFYSWDYGTQNPGYQNSNITIFADGGWQPFLHQIIGPGNNGNEFDATTFISNVTTLTGTISVNTRWAGILDYSVNMTDTDGIGQGFRTTRNWSLVFCDRLQDRTQDNLPPFGDFVKGDLTRFPPDEYMSTTPLPTTNRSLFIEFLPVIFQNQIQVCTTGTCSFQLVTRLLVNLDQDNNGQVDPQYLIPSGYRNAGQPAPLCFYAEAQRPRVSNWAGNLQARIAAGGGDKTVNFRMNPAPTAVSLSSFNVTTNNGGMPVVELAMVGLVLGAVSLTTVGMRKNERH